MGDTDVISGSVGDQAGIRPGDLITRVGTEKIKSKKDFIPKWNVPQPVDESNHHPVFGITSAGVI
ncbi:MAG: PDZ domain-containing protein [Fidelibacterota bacterium]